MGQGEREAQKEFWEEHSKEGSLEEMMLDTCGSEIASLDRPEIMSYLPPLKDKRVMELGAGIGRFTGLLANEAREVVAVDFMEGFCAKNRLANGQLDNLTVVCSDVTSLVFDQCRFDVVFGNWLLMYLSDDEVKDLCDAIMTWLAPRGYWFFRESCFHQSGNRKRGSNPTHYRTPQDYDNIVKSVSTSDGSHFELIEAHSVVTYERMKNNANQRTWLWRKIPGMARDSLPVQVNLESSQYSTKGVDMYERVFGKGFISTGGRETTEEFVKKLKLQKGDYVLDVGSGLGGGSFYMAESCECRILGIDLSDHMVRIAKEKANGMPHLKSRVQFIVGDVTDVDYDAHTYDVIYSRDTLLHIADKKILLAKFKKWLKPGGRLLISDYCCGLLASQSEEFKDYVTQRGYSLLEPYHYGKLLEEAEFSDIIVEDRTNQFVDVLTRELARLKANSEEFIKEFSQSDYKDIVIGWEAKLLRCSNGDQKWALMTAINQ